MPPKKIAFIYLNAYTSIGGIQKFNLNFLAALEKIGENKDIVISCYSLNDKKSDIVPLNNLTIWTAEGNKLLLINKVLKELFAADQIFFGHINLSFPLIYFFKFSSLLKSNVTLLITHGIEAWRIKSFFKKNAFKSFDKILTVSQFTKNKILMDSKIRKDKIYIFPNTIEPTFLIPDNKKSDQLLKKYSLSASDKLLLTVCRIATTEKEKGYDKVIEAVSMVLKRYPEIKYILAGKTEDLEKKRLENIIENLSVKDQIIFTGSLNQEELMNHYSLCDLFIMPSTKEGFGIVFLEAIMALRPVIGGNVDGTVDALLEGKIGRLIHPNVNDISTAIIEYFEGKWPSHLYDLEHHRKLALENFGFEKFKNRLSEIIYH